MKQKHILNSILTITAAAAIVGCSTGTSNNRSTGQYIDDKSTAQRVRNNLGKDSVVKATRIHVESFRGNVHLTGFVDYAVQKQTAEEIARNTEGVEFVKDDIIVKSDLPNQQINGNREVTEPSGARREGARLQGSTSTHSSQFQSSANTSASVASASSAGWVRGNKGMNSELYPGEFKGEASGAERRTGVSATTGSRSVETSVQTSAPGFHAQATTQGDLATRVKSELQSDTTLNGQNVTVQQDGDKIILRGTVATRDQKQALEAKAKTIPGVKSVSNKIDVQ
jgi:osmotically-inducible protein OsmY